ncbi:MAG: hypothetical protein AB8G18_19810 [Gammaproteobacteria bacterium]
MNMNKQAGPWALVRHVWAQKFQQNPVGTVVGSVLTLGAVGFMLFFGFFVVIALVVMGGLFVLANAIFGAPTRRTTWSTTQGGVHDSAQTGGESARSDSNSQLDNNELEGEFTVVSDKETDRT